MKSRASLTGHAEVIPGDPTAPLLPVCGQIVKNPESRKLRISRLREPSVKC